MKYLFFFSLLIFYSLNSMAQWDLIKEDSALWNITDLHFFNQDTGVISGAATFNGGFYMRTIDGGDNWTFSTSPNYTGSVESIFFVNDTLGYSTGRDADIKKLQIKELLGNLHLVHLVLQ